MCMLYQLSKQDYYGYHLIKEMRNFFADVNDSTFYAILRRLFADGNTEIYYGDESLGPKRKYYRITASGKRVLQESIESWIHIVNSVQKIGIS